MRKIFGGLNVNSGRVSENSKIIQVSNFFLGEKMTGQKNSVKKWTIDDVSEWLRENGFDEYVDLFASHKIDGSVLVHLTETDLREPPMKLTVLGDIKRIGLALSKLKRESSDVSSLASSASTVQPVVVRHRDADANGLVVNPNDPRT